MSEYIDDNSSNENEKEVFASDIADMQEKSKQDTNENPENVQENVGEQGGVGQDYSYGTGQNPGDSAGYNEGVQSGPNQSEYNPYGGNVQYKWNYDDYQNALNNKGKPPRKKNKGLRAFVISICSVAVVAVICLAGVAIYDMANGKSIINNLGTSSSSSNTAKNPNAPALTTNDKPSGTTSSSISVSPLQMSNQQVYNAVKNSVVTIEVFTTQSVDPDAEGSGIVESADGYIITNEHVIDGAKRIEVVLADSKQYTATLVGSDLRTDLAVLKIDATGLTPASFGNSDQINVAESVLAIGNPGGLGGSVTEGIISAVNRTITENNYSENCIQTDAPINPGNSGGALVNMYGQVIGITSSKIAATGYEGMGFAIPINTARPIINSIAKYGYVTGRVKIGISVQQYEGSTAYGYPAGLQILNVDSSSDAASKGLKQNDIITKINGIAVTSYDQFYQEEIKYKAGDAVMLTVYRYTTKSTFDVSVKLAEDKGDVVPTTQQNSSTQSGNGFGN